MDEQRTDQAKEGKGHDEHTDLAEHEQLEQLQRFAEAIRPPRVEQPEVIRQRLASSEHKETRKEKKVLHIDQEMGTLEISASVIAEIVREEGPRTEGVVEIRGKGLRNKIKKLFAPGRLAEGVYVEKNDNLLHMEVTLAVRYGMNIPALAEIVRRRLAEKIEHITGYRVVTINLVVDRIMVIPESRAEQPQARV